MRSSVLIPAVLALSVACSITPVQAQPLGWAEYRNDKYGFSLRYPPDLFAVERTAEAGDGQVFVTPSGDARLLVGALVNDSGFSPGSYQAHVARQSYGNFRITYQPMGKTWFALSGEGDGKIFYEKVMFSCSGRLINSFAMIYPASRREVFDAIVERMEDTFQPGDACERAGLPPVDGKSKRAASPSQRWARAPRSSLADRIARQRGRDVIVVLQRTTPPYDRKYVRGYVSRP
jgi:hypothetical protein